MRNTFLRVGVLVVAIVTWTNLALANPGSLEERGSLQVTGNAVITGAPDVAYVTLGVETKDPSAQVASQENADRMAGVFAALKALGLIERDITTSGYNIYSSNQVIARGTEGEQTITTYHVQNRINITTRDLANVGKIIDAAIKAGANQVQGVRFDIEDKQGMQLEALKNAVQQGKAKAEVMATAAGITLGGLATINENYSSYAPMVNTMARSTTINPGEVEVSATVSMDFWF